MIYVHLMADFTLPEFVLDEIVHRDMCHNL
jgi:hypothetical protein